MKTNKNKISVLGGGSWGTVLAYLASANGNSVNLWMRNKESANEINTKNINSKYLPSLNLSKDVFATNDLSDVSDSELVIFCVPSDSFREVTEAAVKVIRKDIGLVTATKGVEKGGFKLMSNVLREHFPDNPIGIISGPNLAEEIANHNLSGTVIASKEEKLRKQVVKYFSSEFFKVYENDDPYGVEMGGAFKKYLRDSLRHC